MSECKHCGTQLYEDDQPVCTLCRLNEAKRALRYLAYERIEPTGDTVLDRVSETARLKVLAALAE